MSGPIALCTRVGQYCRDLTLKRPGEGGTTMRAGPRTNPRLAHLPKSVQEAQGRDLSRIGQILERACQGLGGAYKKWEHSKAGTGISKADEGYRETTREQAVSRGREGETFHG